MPLAGSRQFVEQRLHLFGIGSIHPGRSPRVDTLDGRAGQGADCLFAAGPRDEIRRVRAAGARSLPQVLDPGGVEFVPALFHLDPGNVAHIATSVFCRPACSCREGNLR